MKRISLPESKSVKEVRAWRRKVQSRAEKVGWEKYLKALGKGSSLWIDDRMSVVRERPSRKYGK